MITKLRSLFLVALSIWSIQLASATEYYVSKSGDNANVGTEEAPFLTISKASAVMTAGDVCIIKEGLYRETVNPLNAGTAGSPIVYKAFEGDSVVVTGTEPVTNWEQHSGPIYKATATLGSDIRYRMLYVGGKVMDLARWPNNADHNPYTLEADSVIAGSRAHVMSQGIPSYNWSGAYIYYLGAHSGASWTGPANAVSTTRVDFNSLPDKWPFNPHNPTVFRNGNRGRFYLFNALDALDIAEEWYYDTQTKTVYLYAPGGVDPDDLSVEVASRKEAINITKDYIHIVGIRTFGGLVNLGGDNCEIRECTITRGFQALDEMFNNSAQIGEASLKVNGSNILVEGNLIEFSSSNGILLGEQWNGHSDNVINNNIIRYINTIGNHSSPIRSNQIKATITNNTLYTTGRDGMYINGNNSTVAYNNVYDCMKINNDGGIFYVVGNANDKNTVIHHNWFHDSKGPAYADGRVAGIYLDNNSKGYLVHHNAIWNITWTGIQLNWDNWNIDIYNNSIYDAHDGAMGRWENGYTIKDIVLKNNYASKVSTRGTNDNQQYVINGWVGTDVSSTSNVIDEAFPFISLEDQDFRPMAGSALIDKGETIAGITDGFIGDAPDIGAYEADGELWLAGADWEAYNYTLGEEIEEEEEEEEEVVLGAQQQAIVFYPNPVVNEIHFSDAVKHYQLIDAFGRVIAEQSTTSKIHSTLNLSNLRKGMYFMKVITIDNQYKSQLLIKK